MFSILAATRISQSAFAEFTVTSESIQTDFASFNSDCVASELVRVLSSFSLILTI